MQNKNIAIIGAGIGGILALQLLREKLKNTNFILIGNNDFFVFTPRLTEILSGEIPEKSWARPTQIFNDKNAKVIVSKANKVDLKKQEIYLDKDKKIRYDIVVFAQGAKTNFFGLKNAEKNCLEYKDLKDVQKLRKLTLDSIKKINNKKNKKRGIAIIGGGPTGTELAFALRRMILHHKKEYPNINALKDIEISIYQSDETLVKGQHSYIIKKAAEEAKKLNINVYTKHHAIDIKNNKIFFENDGPKKADIIVWAAGVTSNVIKTEPKIELQNNAMPVKKTLQLTNFENAFAIGDCAFSVDKDNKPYPKTAQIAVQHAYHLSKNIQLFIKKRKLRPFNYKIRGFFLALGNHRTAALFLSLKFDGKLGGMLRHLYYKHIFRKLVGK